MNIFDTLPDEPSMQYLFDKVQLDGLSNEFADNNFNIKCKHNSMIIKCALNKEIDYRTNFFNGDDRLFEEESRMHIHIYCTSTGFNSRYKLQKILTNPFSGHMYQVCYTNETRHYQALESALYSLILKATIEMRDESKSLKMLHDVYNVSI